MSIEELRKKIDQVDREIIRLLNERAGAAKGIGEAKKKQGLPFFDSGRQKMILDRLCKQSKGPFPETGLRNVYIEIMSSCLNIESQMTIGFLGPEATFTHIAAKEMFGSSADYIPYKSVEDVFTACEKGWTNYGVVPIETAAGGVIHNNLDRFMQSNLIICSETALSIHHSLMANCPLEKIQHLYSHEESFMQCRAWLKQNLPGVKLHEVSSNGEGAKLAAQKEFSGAIASELAAKVYGLKILVRGIQDLKDNVTRFWVIGNQPAAPTGDDKTSIMFSVKDRPGALYDLLKPFHREKINLTKIESRPTKRKPWEYVFFVDLQGHASDPTIASVLHEIEEHCEFMKVMGSYPKNDKPH